MSSEITIIDVVARHAITYNASMDPSPPSDNISIDSSPPSSNPDLEREQAIDGIIQKDCEEFELWMQNPQNVQVLSMPHGALRYMLVPRRIYELSDDPYDVDVVQTVGDNHILSAFIVERKKQPVSDHRLFTEFIESEKQRENMLREEARINKSRFIFVPKEPPEGVDKMHARYHSEIENGELNLGDYITNDVCLWIVNGDVLYVASYFDRSELHKMGVGKSFYTKLHEVARQLGFRFITGGNSERNVGFFTNVLGRHLLGNIRPDQQDHFRLSEEKRTDPELVTVDFLYPEDEAKYLVQ